MDINRLFTDNYSKVYHYIYGIVCDYQDAGDITQDTFINIYRHIDNYNSSLPFINWAIKVAHNAIIDFQRKSSRYNNLLINYEIEKSIENDIPTKDTSIPYFGRYRMVYELRFKECLPTKEISLITGIPNGTILWMISQIKRDRKYD